MVRISELSKFLKPEMVKSGDILEILNAGKSLTAKETPFEKPAFHIEIRLPSGLEKTWPMNMTTCRRLAAVYGDDSIDWVGRKVRVELLRQSVRGEMKMVIYGHPVETLITAEVKAGAGVVKTEPKLTEEEALRRLEGLDLTDEDREKYLENLRQAGLL